jgi:hypothetical protein
MTQQVPARKPGGDLVPLATSATHSAIGRETWLLADGNEPVRIQFGIVLHNVHPHGTCVEPDRCVIHQPTEHHMRAWEAGWDDVRAQVIRRCPHGSWHPDPDAVVISKFGALLEAVEPHTWVCDGCCTL